MFLAQTTTQTADPGAMAAALVASSVGLVFILVVVLFALLIWFMIIRRTGLNPWLALLMLVPVANFIVLIILAFTEWPVQRELKALRAQFAGTGGAMPGAGYAAPPPGYAPQPAPPYNTQIPPPGTPPATS